VQVKYKGYEKLSSQKKCNKCSTVNTSKKHISIELEPESYSMLWR